MRQVSDGEFEVAPHRLEAAQAAAQAAARPQLPAPREPIVDAPTIEAPVPDVETDGRNGQRFGIRFRRGSRGGVRVADVPLIGMVHVDTPDPVLETFEVAAEAPVDEAPARPRARASHPEAGREAQGERGEGRPGRHRAAIGACRRSSGNGWGPAAPAAPPASTSRAAEGRVSRTRRAATLPVRFFNRPAEVVARELLGAVVVSRAGRVVTSGRIVETEAYLGFDDPASHGYRHRRNERNAALFGPPGTWYVYLSYGVHWCANLVCEEEGRASAVLLRALAPLQGLDVMAERRGTAGPPTSLLGARPAVSGTGDDPGARRSLDAPIPHNGRVRLRDRGAGHGGDPEDRDHEGGGLAVALRRGRLAVDVPCAGQCCAYPLGASFELPRPIRIPPVKVWVAPEMSRPEEPLSSVLFPPADVS